MVIECNCFLGNKNKVIGEKIKCSNLDQIMKKT